MMSSGLPPHGEHAWECTVSGIVSMPITRRNAVGTLGVLGHLHGVGGVAELG